MPPTTTTTGNDIIELAYSRLMDVSPESIATEDTSGELPLLVNRALAGLFSVAAQANPWFFGKVATVGFETNEGWYRPADAEAVYRIETGDGTEVVIVPFEQRNIEPGEPTVYMFGQYYRSTQLPLAPVSGNLLIYYSRLPVDITALTDTIDASWPEQFNELLALEVAIYLAIKSNLGPELGALKEDRNAWAARFVAFLQHETLGKRAWATSRRFPPAALSLLAGGGS